MDLSEYKPYPKNTRYLVSKDGNVYSLKHKRLLKQILTKAGYKRVWLWDGGLGKMKGELVHRMVATTYIPMCVTEYHMRCVICQACVRILRWKNEMYKL